MTAIAQHTLDFDNMSEWSPRLRAHLSGMLPDTIEDILRAAAPEYIEDASDVVLQHVDRQTLFDAISAWIKDQNVIGYHGTRLNDAELASVIAEGLRPLVATDRAERLVRSLSAHPRWNEVSPTLDDVLQSYGTKERIGRREGQVHLTVSRAGLMGGFNHYIKQGSEFDWHAANDLLGAEGQALVAADGKPYLVVGSVPGSQAFKACNPWGKHNRDAPNLVRELLHGWSYGLAYPNFRMASLKVDCGMIFYEPFPPEWIVHIQSLEDL